MQHLDGAQGFDLPRPSRTASEILGELLLAVTAALMYFAVRGLMSHSIDTASANADQIVRLERWLRIYWEPAWQGLVVDHQSLVTLSNWAYIYLHWPVIAVVGVWLFLRHHAEYYTYRKAFLISGAIGLVLFLVFPVAPPRLTDLGLADTVTEHSNSYRVLQPPALVNQYAAFPSLHFGWNLLVGIAVYTNAPRRAVRLAGLLLPAIMLFAIVATANHYIIDAVAGGLLALAGLAAARALDARPRKAAA